MIFLNIYVYIYIFFFMSEKSWSIFFIDSFQIVRYQNIPTPSVHSEQSLPRLYTTDRPPRSAVLSVCGSRFGWRRLLSEPNDWQIFLSSGSRNACSPACVRLTWVPGQTCRGGVHCLQRIWRNTKIQREDFTTSPTSNKPYLRGYVKQAVTHVHPSCWEIPPGG